MAERNKISVKSVLDMFREAQTKTAQDMGGMPPDTMPMDPAAMQGVAQQAQPAQPEGPCPQCGSPDGVCVCGGEAGGVAGEDIAAAAQALEAAGANADAAGDAAGQAQQEVVEAGEALKQVADEFINEHTAALKKEAQVFGELFAASCLEQMNKTAALQDATQNAYVAAAEALGGDMARGANQLQKCAEEAYAMTMQKLAGQGVTEDDLYTESYRTTMAKLAGFDDPEDMEEAVGQELSPEEMAAIVAAQQEDAEEPEAVEDEAVEDDEADPLDGMSEEEIQELAEQLAAEDGDEAGDSEPSPEEIAAAAELLAAEHSDDEEEKTAALRDVMGEAYNNVTAALRR